MKVTTLACIQGSWIPKYSIKRVLDIGAGTGLLSLMIAQKNECHIDAVEIEQEAFSQLADNVEASKWSDNISCYHYDIRSFVDLRQSRYDLIISNPPFFAQQQKSPNPKINLARHDKGISIESIIELSTKVLANKGKISILLPPSETELLKSVASLFDLHIINQLNIFDSPQKPKKAIVSILSREKTDLKSSKLYIKNDGPGYSDAFTALLKDYYLNL